MSTHSIGRGKVNVATTFDKTTARVLGRLAYLHGKSRNEFVREIVLKAIVHATATGRLFIALFSLATVLFAAVCGQDMRRSSSLNRARFGRRWEYVA